MGAGPVPEARHDHAGLSVALNARRNAVSRSSAALVSIGPARTSGDAWKRRASEHELKAFRRRIGIARAIAVGPDLIVADEAVSALDVSIQAQIVNLLRDLQRRLVLAMVFISHDLAVVEYITDRVAELYLGRMVEIGPARALVRTPKHPYTEALLSAVPEPTPGRARKRILRQGELPSPTAPPSGCVFRTRCPYAIGACAEAVPALVEVGAGHRSACIRTGVV